LSVAKLVQASECEAIMGVGLLEQPQLAPRKTRPHTRVLIVDDDEAMVDVLSRRLSQQGFETIAADSGEAGLTLARTELPLLILLDLRLPDQDGLAICEELVDSSETCDIPVIILSGLDRPDIIRRCRAAGCHYFVRKPYDPNALLVLIRQAIADSGRADALPQ
jgi:CheY-like chemotaxis protein